MTLLATFGVGAALVGLFLWIRSLLVMGAPNDAIVLFGKNPMPGSDGRGYRVVLGGRTWRHPISEQAQKLSLAIGEVPLDLTDVVTNDGVRFSLQATAIVKVSSDPKLIGSALERFMGRDGVDARRLSKEILEGTLAGLISGMSSNALILRRPDLADEARRTSAPELAKLGLQCESLNLLGMSDSSGYLESQANATLARIASEAAIAESDAKRRAEVAEAEMESRAAVAQAAAEAQASALRNQLRITRMKLDAELASEEARVDVAAREAKVRADEEHQRVLLELEELKQYVDLVLPAEAAREAREVRARADAAHVREKAIANGKAMEAVAAVWQEVGDIAGPVLAMEDVDKFVGAAVNAMPGLKHRDADMAVQSVRSVFAIVSEATGVEIGSRLEPNRRQGAEN